MPVRFVEVPVNKAGVPMLPTRIKRIKGGNTGDSLAVHKFYEDDEGRLFMRDTYTGTWYRVLDNRTMTLRNLSDEYELRHRLRVGRLRSLRGLPESVRVRPYRRRR